MLPVVAPMVAMHSSKCFLVSPLDFALYHDNFLHCNRVSFMSASYSGRPLRSQTLSNGTIRANPSFKRITVCAVKSLSDGSTSLITQKADYDDGYFWAEELSSAMQRLVLESQWMRSFESQWMRSFEEPLPPANSSVGTVAETEVTSSDFLKRQNVVSSGRSSARQRRLNAMLRATSKRIGASLANAAPASDESEVYENWRPRKQDRKKPEAVQDFVTTYMRHISKFELLTKEEERTLSKQLKTGQRLSRVRKELWKELGHEPSYGLWAESAEMSTIELLTKVAEGEKARERMVMANIRLVVSVAKNYRHQGVELADLIQEGSKGLIRGLEKYDHTKGFKISTYVHWWIRQGVTRVIAEHSRVMRLPVHMHEKLFRVKRIKSQLMAEGKTVTVQGISEALNISCEKVETTLKANPRISSLDMARRIGGRLEESDSTMHDIFSDRDPQNQPWAVVDGDQLREDLKKLMSSLTQMEQNVLQWHHGLGTVGGRCWTLQCVGERLGLSKERVRQIEQSAIKKMQMRDQQQRWRR